MTAVNGELPGIGADRLGGPGRRLVILSFCHSVIARLGGDFCDIWLAFRVAGTSTERRHPVMGCRAFSVRFCWSFGTLGHDRDTVAPSWPVIGNSARFSLSREGVASSHSVVATGLVSRPGVEFGTLRVCQF